MTRALKQLIVDRERVFHSSNQQLSRHYRQKTQDEILVRKRSYYSIKVQYLESSDPRKWWDSVKNIAGKKKTSPPIKIVRYGATMSGKDLTQLFNYHFLSINADLPCLDLGSLPAYLSALQPAEIITPMEVCAKMLKVSASKSHGSDGMLNPIIKEFAYELADPVCDIFNTSLSTGLVPSIWKDGNITTIPKDHSVSCEDELRPITLTACLFKILEDFVVRWMILNIKLTRGSLGA